MSTKTLPSRTMAITTKTRHPFYRCRKLGGKLQHKYQLTVEERRSIIGTMKLGDPALLLYEYYLHMAGWDNAPITDEDIAKYFGWTPRKARRLRSELEKQGWIRTKKFSFPGGEKGIVYFIGKEMVAQAPSKIVTSLFINPAKPVQ